MSRSTRNRSTNTETQENETMTDTTSVDFVAPVGQEEPNAPEATTNGYEHPVPETPTPAKRNTNVGEISVRTSTRTDLSTRVSPSDTHPVFLAVKEAPFDTATDILVDPADVKTVIRIIRRSAQPDKLNVGMTVYAGNPVAEEDPSKVIVTFLKREERKTVTKKPKADASVANEGSSTN
jgi:hypothetical protein